MTNTTQIPTQIPTQIVLKTLRFKFSNDIMEQISIFAKIHEYDDRQTFKDEWTEWLNNTVINDLITKEIERIELLGFTGDILDKMYKSARYYYRKKSLVQIPPINRKEYEVISKLILESMDNHIKLQIASHINDNQPKLEKEKEKETEKETEKCKLVKVSPADCFNNFCTLNQELILVQLKPNNTDNQPVNSAQIRTVMDKLKKIYKNRFYNIRVKLL
jgi:hypothetical protein